jgi:putative transposase
MVKKKTLCHNRNVTFLCYYHVVWGTKYRRDVLKNGADERLKKALFKAAKDKKGTIEELEIMPDHVHLLLSIDPQFGIHKIVKYLKGASSRILRREFRPCRTRLPCLWTNSYFVATVGGAPLKIIKEYIKKQKDG